MLDEEEVLKLIEALRPLARVASRIPDNWPGECVLTHDINYDKCGQRYSSINYIMVGVDSSGITINEYREAQELLERLEQTKGIC